MSAFTMKPTNNVDFEVPPAGTHPAVLVAIIDLGTHENDYQGKKTIAHKVYLAWELTAEKKADGSNFIIGREYTLSFAKKANLRALVEKWRGKAFGENEEFDLSKLAGKPCLLSIIHNENGYAKVEGVSQPPKGMKVEKASHEPVLWEIGSVTDFPTDEWLPYSYGKPLSDVIKQSSEYKASANGKPMGTTAKAHANNESRYHHEDAAAKAAFEAAAKALDSDIPF